MEQIEEIKTDEIFKYGYNTSTHIIKLAVCQYQTLWLKYTNNTAE